MSLIRIVRENVKPPFDICIYRTTDDSVLRVLDGSYHRPHLWVESEIPDNPQLHNISDITEGLNYGLYLIGITIEGDKYRKVFVYKYVESEITKMETSQII